MIAHDVYHTPDLKECKESRADNFCRWVSLKPHQENGTTASMIAIKGLVWVSGFTHMWEELGERRYRRLKKEEQRSRHEKFQPQYWNGWRSQSSREV